MKPSDGAPGGGAGGGEGQRRVRDPGRRATAEFCDTSDGDGYFREYAAFVVGSEIMPRSLSLGRSWALKHSGTEFSREMLAEENAFILANPHEAQLRRIFEMARAGYGRIDYAVKDGQVETWEINLNPTIGRGQGQSRGIIPEELQPFREEARRHFSSRFEAALRPFRPLLDPIVRLMFPWLAKAARRR